MEARSRIWEELKQAKANIICLQKYTDKHRAHNRYYSAFIAFTASAGALGYPICEEIPFISSLLIGFASIVKSILPSFLQPETELSELDCLMDFYVSYMNSLERIWYDFDKDIIDEVEAMKRFFDLKECECEKQSAMNRGIRNITCKFQKQIDQEAGEYINRVYFRINEPNN